MRVYPAAPAPQLGLIAESGEEKIPERLLAEFWKERAARQTGLRTEAGKRVRVVYPGRPGVTAGPDFRDALLEVEGVGLVRGDVELHLRQRDWDAHGHGGGPNYNGVVVHGALEVFSTETRLQSGTLAPVMDLRSLLTDVPGPGPALGLWRVLSRKGFHRPETLEEAEMALERAGDHRFLAKSRWLATCIQADGPDQALGHAAGELPSEARFTAISGWLSACSGLEASGSTANPPDWKQTRRFGPAMDRKEWRLFRIRPANHPRRRIMGAAVLLERHLESGLAAGLREVVETLSPAKLTGALSAISQSGPAYVGRGRAKDLAVNAVLPFLHAWDETPHGQRRSGAAEALYRRFPLLAENEITREMTAQLIPVG